MKVKSKRARRIWYERSERTSDPVLALAMLTITERWAGLMEPYLAAGTPMSVVAEPTHKAAARDHPDLALHSALCDSMVDYLEACWVHGRALRKWYGAVILRRGD